MPGFPIFAGSVGRPVGDLAWRKAIALLQTEAPPLL